MKVSEAKQRKLESDHRLRVLHSEIEMRRRQDQEQNFQAIADLRVRAQEVEDLRTQNGRLQAMLRAENETSQDYTGTDCKHTFKLKQINHVKIHYQPLVELIGAPLESEVKSQQLKINDMVDEASEYVKENLRLKDQVHELTMNALPAQSDQDIDKVRSELLSERKSNLVKLTEKDQIIWKLNKEQEDKRISILDKEGEISMLKAKIQGLEWDLDNKRRQHPDDQFFSAAIQLDPDTQRLVRELRDALEGEG
eukprot:s1743_g10.t1